MRLSLKRTQENLKSIHTIFALITEHLLTFTTLSCTILTIILTANATGIVDTWSLVFGRRRKEEAVKESLKKQHVGEIRDTTVKGAVLNLY